MARYGDASVLGGVGMLEWPLVVPAGALVEGAGSCVAGDDGEPRLAVPICANLSFGLPHQSMGDAGSAIARGHVELFDLVAGDNDETGDCSAENGYGCLARPLRCSGSERFLCPGGEQLLRNEPQVTISPTEMPNLSNVTRILFVASAKDDVWVARHHFATAPDHVRQSTSAPEVMLIAVAVIAAA